MKKNGSSNNGIGKQISVLTGSSNPELAMEICEYLGIPLGQAVVDRFPEGEIHVQIQDNIRGKDVFIIQSTSSPPNDH